MAPLCNALLRVGPLIMIRARTMAARIKLALAVSAFGCWLSVRIGVRLETEGYAMGQPSGAREQPIAAIKKYSIKSLCLSLCLCL